MDAYLGCPEKYRHRYEADTIPRPVFTANVGSAFHQAIEVYVKSKYTMTFSEAMYWSIANIETFPPSVIKEALEIGSKWLSEGPLPPVERIFGAEVSFAPPGKYLRGKKPHNEIKFDSGLAVHGYIDMIYEDGDTIVVVDYKTQRSWISPEQLSAKIQAMTYALVAHRITNRPIRVEFHMIRYPEDGAVVWVPEPDKWSEIEEILSAYQTAIRLDEHPEARPDEDCRWCPYNYACKDYQTWAENAPVRKMWENMSLNERIEDLNEWHARFSVARDSTNKLKELVLNEMQIRNIDQIGRWRINRKAKSTWAPEAAAIIAQYGGLSHVPSRIQIELRKYKSTTYGKPYLFKVWKK